MKKKLSISLFLFFLLTCNTSIFSQENPEEIEPIQVSDNLYAITDLGGGNIAFLVTEDGIIVVDATYLPSVAKKLVSIIQTVSDKPIKYLILTHSHGDHINGIAGFPNDIKIIAQENLTENNMNFTEARNVDLTENRFPEYLAGLKMQMDSTEDKNSDEYKALEQRYNRNNEYFQELKTIKFREPEVTFADKYELELGGEKIILEYPGGGHTNDNIIVKFPKHNAIHTGDLIFNEQIPYVIVEHGANIQGWVKILDQFYSEKFDYVIPGHGNLTNNEIFKIQAEYFKELTKKVKTLKNEGLSLDEIKNKIDIAEFGLTLSADQFPVNIEAIYNEL